MSRVGKHPVAIPAGVNVDMDGLSFRARGAKGEVAVPLSRNAIVEMKDGSIVVTPKSQAGTDRAMWGTTRRLIANAVHGVSAGFARKLEINGVGYRAQMQGSQLVLQLGYSHDVKYSVPSGIKITCPDQTHIVIEGADKELVGQVASEIRGYRPVEPYKGKGIKYDDEFVVRKEGKKK